ncbi:MAG: hypothetical protein EBZ48_07535 [Proteobacteria bacterium]|nr:hypothetical protein [Pseudomonadota bacterium]
MEMNSIFREAIQLPSIAHRVNLLQFKLNWIKSAHERDMKPCGILRRLGMQRQIVPVPAVIRRKQLLR